MLGQIRMDHAIGVRMHGRHPHGPCWWPLLVASFDVVAPGLPCVDMQGVLLTVCSQGDISRSFFYVSSASDCFLVGMNWRCFFGPYLQCLV